MRDSTEANRWLRDAQACLASAQRALTAQDYRVTVQNAQLCVELSAKAVIAHLAEPLWSHDPSPQLRRLIREHQEAIIERCGEEMVTALQQLADDAEEAAPWHGWSTYGREVKDEGWIAAVDTCTQESADDLLPRAQRSWRTAQTFATRWSAPPCPVHSP